MLLLPQNGNAPGFHRALSACLSVLGAFSAVFAQALDRLGSCHLLALDRPGAGIRRTRGFVPTGVTADSTRPLVDVPKLGKASRNKCIASSNKCPSSSNKKLLVTSASLLVTSALLVVTRSY